MGAEQTSDQQVSKKHSHWPISRWLASHQTLRFKARSSSEALNRKVIKASQRNDSHFERPVPPASQPFNHIHDGVPQGRVLYPLFFDFFPESQNQTGS